jgi:hypothetical protein
MDPFEAPKINLKNVKKMKKPSKIDELSVGAIRFSFLQLRSCPELDVNYVLWTGVRAGDFALQYLLMSSAMKKK